MCGLCFMSVRHNLSHAYACSSACTGLMYGGTARPAEHWPRDHASSPPSPVPPHEETTSGGAMHIPWRLCGQQLGGNRRSYHGHSARATPVVGALHVAPAGMRQEMGAYRDKRAGSEDAALRPCCPTLGASSRGMHGGGQGLRSRLGMDHQ